MKGDILVQHFENANAQGVEIKIVVAFNYVIITHEKDDAIVESRFPLYALVMAHYPDKMIVEQCGRDLDKLIGRVEKVAE